MATEERRLTGEDASLMRCNIGTVAQTTSLPAKTWVKVAAKASSSSRFGELDVGDFFYNTTSTPIAVTSGDTWYSVTPTAMLDMAGWSLEITADKLDVTTTADSVRKFRTGKLDSSGSCSFVLIKGITDVAGGVMNSFFKIVDIDDTGAATASPIDTASYFLLGYLDGTDEVAGHHKLATFMEVEFEGFPLNFKMNEASNVDINFHLTGSTNPIIYRLENPA
jgi:hypothetical protein